MLCLFVKKSSEYNAGSRCVHIRAIDHHVSTAGERTMSCVLDGTPIAEIILITACEVGHLSYQGFGKGRLRAR
jgi:hypothetical protein